MEKGKEYGKRDKGTWGLERGFGGGKRRS